MPAARGRGRALASRADGQYPASIGQSRSTVCARSVSLPEPTSISATPAVACGTKTLSSPSPKPAQKSATSAVRSVTSARPLATEQFTSVHVAHLRDRPARPTTRARGRPGRRWRTRPIDRSRMCEREPHRVQPLPSQADFRRERRVGAIRKVADARMPQRRHMHPDLMRSTGLELDLEQAGHGVRLERFVVRDARLAVGDDGELVVVYRVPIDGRVDGAARRIRMTLDERVVGLVDGPIAKGLLQHGVGMFALRDHHEPAGADVEAMHHALTFFRARGRHAIAGRDKCSDDGRPVPARDSDARRRRPVCRPPRCRRRRRRSASSPPASRRSPARPRPPRADRPRATLLRRPVRISTGDRAVEPHQPLTDQLDRARARESEEPGHRRVEPFALEALGHGQSAQVGRRRPVASLRSASDGARAHDCESAIGPRDAPPSSASHRAGDRSWPTGPRACHRR